MTVPILERANLGMGSPLMRPRRRLPSPVHHQIVDICIKPKQWRPIRDLMEFDGNDKYVQLTLEKSDGYHTNNLALLGPDYDHEGLPDASKISLVRSFINVHGEEKSVFIQLTPHYDLKHSVLQDRRAVIAQTMWNVVNGVTIDLKSPLMYNFNALPEDQSPMIYSAEEERLATDKLGPKLEKDKECADR
ncbi:uncharacterized protein RHO25_000688 [Cercospora beticola]|uniref:Uncharacterized protein n=2 Tax=Cercospora beticola TaxID=122368 RepID=A0ABZ0N960_CERBT|nr:hypothetical protein RHO25_000688 [Cercospora beticola]